jgi:MFS family permease
LIIWAALWVTVARYVGAFLASDLGQVTGWVSEVLTGLMALSGVGMGFLDVLGLAYVFDGWRKSLPKTGDKWSNRFSVLTVFVVSLFVVGVVILVPFTVARISSAGMYDTLPGLLAWVWALAVNLAPYLLIGGVTFSHSGFVTITSAESSTESSGNFRKDSVTSSDVGDWRNLPEDDRQIIRQLSTADVTTRYGVSERTARNWKAKANGNGKVTQ